MGNPSNLLNPFKRHTQTHSFSVGLEYTYTGSETKTECQWTEVRTMSFTLVNSKNFLLKNSERDTS